MLCIVQEFDDLMLCACFCQEIPSDDKFVEDDGTRRRAKWWYSTFHTVTAMVGAGVLSLPYAMAYLGWYIFSYVFDYTSLNCYMRKFNY